MPCYDFAGVVPVIHPSAYVHPSAVLIGDVIVGPGCYVGPCACLRGDFGRIVLQDGANVQDTCVVHGGPERDTVIEPDGHVGHGAVLHCAVVRRDALVGINAVVMDGAEVGEQAIVAASAFVPAGAKLAPRSLVAGVPAKVLRELSAEECRRKTHGTRIYQELTRRSLQGLREASPLAAPEPGRPRLPDIFGAVAADTPDEP